MERSLKEWDGSNSVFVTIAGTIAFDNNGLQVVVLSQSVDELLVKELEDVSVTRDLWEIEADTDDIDGIVAELDTEYWTIVGSDICKGIHPF